MLFNSLGFFLFLPLVLAVHAALPVRRRWAWLLIASYAFYASFEPSGALYLAAVTLVIYGCGWGMGQSAHRPIRVALLAAGLLIVLGLLVTFKFYDFVAGEFERAGAALLATDATFNLPRLGVAAPVGFSFYAFSGASYLIDVYLQRLAPQRHGGHVALYTAFFPKILAGPIERATTFLPQVGAGLRIEPANLVSGLQLIGWGLFKKVVIADNLAPLVDRAFSIAAYASPIELLVAVYFFAFQIYCDFSGYTDIAIGVSLLFGITLMENFRRPYLARSTAEFWGQRWHISLGRWFRDYLYIPLGGSQAGRVRRYANLMSVFVVSGLWHAGLGYGVGWTFLVWGALNGFYQWIGLATAPLWRWLGDHLPRVSASTPLLVVRVLVTFHLIAIAWVFFRAASVSEAVLILQKIAAGIGKIVALLPRYPFTAEHYLGFGLIALLIVIEILDERRSIWKRLAAAPLVLRWGVYYAGIFALLILGRWQAREFIYMQF
ncbi:MAG: MBOAT family O-acyltransferase [Planctomycetota bacterium]|jgi:D-alanyl-lipoteichoic acid acyltransferase DltB (MBOAT superfamily)